ncbi:YfbK domain-containing protein [Pseudotabrizicola formosa]|uniref:YfbK domain-containing protein n=1 Tax=Pseudotabrizicola formosa TaxID=2030009 RepID=UPI000CD28B98|nr:von Willebrand factor type A domain-containing protein [Pseudotabrizicola formosa]
MTRDPDFERLRAALQAPPASDAAAKARAMNRAMAAYEDSALSRQGLTPPLRPLADRAPTVRGASAVRRVLKSLSVKPLLAATTSAAALTVGLVVLLPQSEVQTPGGGPSELAQRSQDMAVPSPAEPPEAAPMMTRRTAPAEAQPERAAESTAAEQGDAATPPSLAAPDSAPMAEGPEAKGFANAGVNPLRVTAEAPVSAFPAKIGTASYALVRSSLMAGALPRPDAVRVEEMVNHFPYAYPAPEAGEPPFRANVTVMPTPWNPDTRLVQIGLQGRLPEVAARPPLNLVLLIDTSESMDTPDRLPLLKQALRLMLAEMRQEDQVAIVAYAGTPGEVLAPTPANQSATILAALDQLETRNPLAETAGLTLAYSLAEGMTAAGEVSRILLATDGDFNLGVDDPEGMEGFVARKGKTGVNLSVLAFGRDALDEAVMQSLAQNGNGSAASVATLNEARKVLMDQLTGPLFPIADEVTIDVEWNPGQVAEYRLIGHETQALQPGQSTTDAAGMGAITAGHQVTALYEVTAPGSPALRNDPLRYGTAVSDAMADAAATGEMAQDAPELGFVRLRYKAPGESVNAVIEMPIVADTGTGPDARFAAAIAGFGQLLRASADLEDWGWDQAITLAEANRGEDPFGYRDEAVTLMRLAQSLAQDAK